MKTIYSQIAIFAFMLLNTVSYSQEKEKILSNAEETSTKSGVLIEKTYIKIGSVLDVLVQSVKTQDLIEKTKNNYLLFEHKVIIGSSTYTRKGTIDIKEIADLINAIKYIQSNVFTTTKKDYTEVNYYTSTGIKIGCFSNKDKWKGYIKLDEHYSDSFTSFSPEEFSILLEFIETGKKVLEE